MQTIAFIVALIAMGFAFDADSKVKKLQKRVEELERNRNNE